MDIGHLNHVRLSDLTEQELEWRVYHQWGVIKQQKAKAKLNFHDETKVPRSDPRSRELPEGSTRKKPKSSINVCDPETLGKVKIGAIGKLNSFKELSFVTLPNGP